MNFRCGVYVCVCERERERERDRQTDRETERGRQRNRRTDRDVLTIRTRCIETFLEHNVPKVVLRRKEKSCTGQL